MLIHFIRQNSLIKKFYKKSKYQIYLHVVLNVFNPYLSINLKLSIIFLMYLYLGRWHATGIVSSGYECARSNAYGLYTRVTTDKEWIVDRLLKSRKKNPFFWAGIFLVQAVWHQFLGFWMTLKNVVLCDSSRTSFYCLFWVVIMLLL